MKRRDLIRKLEQLGCVLTRHGSNHDWYSNLLTKQSQAIPRHNEINEHLARTILKAMANDNL
jgi:predicted RNA binding protein YcfA (HicA-like mRNA interferase family)